MPRPPVLATTWIACAAHLLGIVASVVATSLMWDPEGGWLFSAVQRIAFTAVASASVLCCAAALIAEWRRRAASAVILRQLFVAVVAFATAQWLLSNRFHAVLAWLAASAALLAFALLRLWWPRLSAGAWRGLGRRLDRGLFQMSLVVVLLEGGLRVVSAFSRNPLFGLLDEDEHAVMERFAMAPGYLHLGFPSNEKGHYDEPFKPGTGQRNVVVSIGDSFAVGVVPHHFHFTTVCERDLPGVAVHNLGIVAIGPAGYHHLLVEQGLALQPDAVVINLFLGNDIGTAARWRDSSSWLASFLDRRNIRLIQLPIRFLRTWNEPAAQAPEADAHPLGIGDLSQAHGEAALRRALPWLDDPLLEKPMFTPETFRQIEVERARMLERAEVRGLYRNTFDALAAMHKACGSVPFAVVLIPDEFQVEDALWADVAARGKITIARDDPQRRVARWLEEQGIPFVDLLPELLAVQPLADGRRHVYHLRDTHFNARGNEVAGHALARLVRTLLGK